jgi:hypothetical protein
METYILKYIPSHNLLASCTLTDAVPPHAAAAYVGKKGLLKHSIGAIHFLRFEKKLTPLFVLTAYRHLHIVFVIRIRVRSNGRMWIVRAISGLPSLSRLSHQTHTTPSITSCKTSAVKASNTSRHICLQFCKKTKPAFQLQHNLPT